MAGTQGSSYSSSGAASAANKATTKNIKSGLNPSGSSKTAVNYGSGGSAQVNAAAAAAARAAASARMSDGGGGGNTALRAGAAGAMSLGRMGNENTGRTMTSSPMGAAMGSFGGQGLRNAVSALQGTPEYQSSMAFRSPLSGNAFEGDSSINRQPVIGQVNPASLNMPQAQQPTQERTANLAAVASPGFSEAQFGNQRYTPGQMYANPATQGAALRSVVNGINLQGGTPQQQSDAMARNIGYQSTNGVDVFNRGSGDYLNAMGIPKGNPAGQTAFGVTMKSGIEDTAKSLGISPQDLAAAISYETKGTFDPTQPGPRTQWGQHRGLIQFGEPQAKEYGVDWNNPIGSQLGPNGAVANYLRDTGVKPGMGLLDVYSAINAGGVGRYNASDADNGGAPGTVADKVNKQMAGHIENAQRMFGASRAAPETQLASADNPGMLSSRVVNGKLENYYEPVPTAGPPTQTAGIGSEWGNSIWNKMPKSVQDAWDSGTAAYTQLQDGVSQIPGTPQQQAKVIQDYKNGNYVGAGAGYVSGLLGDAFKPIVETGDKINKALGGKGGPPMKTGNGGAERADDAIAAKERAAMRDLSSDERSKVREYMKQGMSLEEAIAKVKATKPGTGTGGGTTTTPTQIAYPNYYTNWMNMPKGTYA